MNPNPICALPNAHLTRPSLDLNASAENKSGIISRHLWKLERALKRLEHSLNCKSFSRIELGA
jgi:hypothetical protein